VTIAIAIQEVNVAQLDRQLTTETGGTLYVRASAEEVQRDISNLTGSPVVDGLMRSVGGLFAILNRHRQIIAVNDFFLRYLGVKDGGALLGLRPGEAITCLRAHDAPGGCGTGRYCATCGIAIALATSLSQECSAERKCVASIQRNGSTTDVCLNVRSTPYPIGGKTFLMLLLQDISEQERLAELEQVFIHDIGNILTGLLGASGIHLNRCADDPELAGMIHRSTMRLKREFELRKGFAHVQDGEFPLQLSDVAIGDVIAELRDTFKNHPAARDKVLFIADHDPNRRILTDPPLLTRILVNLLINAFEASDGGGEVRLSIGFDEKNVSFSVWNSKVIPDAIGLRIFQRFFSTKAEYGRGLGTYMVKKFGEEVLGGKVGFSSSEDAGTEFHLSLPLHGRHAGRAESSGGRG
jgi:hypothetical protein